MLFGHILKIKGRLHPFMKYNCIYLPSAWCTTFLGLSIDIVVIDRAEKEFFDYDKSKFFFSWIVKVISKPAQI